MRFDLMDSLVKPGGHSLQRTSPIGEPFVGTCRLCGTPGLTTASENDDCPNQRGLSFEEALMEAIEPDKRAQS